MLSVDPTDPNRKTEPPISEDVSLLRHCWMHVHVPKAGGSTIRQLMNRNFGDGYYNSKSLLETKQYDKQDVGEIVRCHPGVRCLSDHKLSLDLPYESEHARILALSYVRDPVERFISRYFFHRHFEEVNCLAQRMSFREFANAELINQDVHPQTNSQIYFLNGGKSFDDMTIIKKALNSGHAFLFPIERFDESCICLERLFPNFFSDLSYVRANVSNKDTEVTEEDRQLVYRYVKLDDAVFALAQNFLDETLDRAFHSKDDRDSALAEFQNRCSRRFHNFYPPVGPGEPVPPIGTIPQPKAKKPPAPEMAADKPIDPDAPSQHDPSSSSESKATVEPKPTLATQPTAETHPTLSTDPTDSSNLT